LARFRFLVRCSSIGLPSSAASPAGPKRPHRLPSRIHRPYRMQLMETLQAVCRCISWRNSASDHLIRNSEF
jgi:hypothetical protein